VNAHLLRHGSYVLHLLGAAVEKKRAQLACVPTSPRWHEHEVEVDPRGIRKHSNLRGGGGRELDRNDLALAIHPAACWIAAGVPGAHHRLRAVEAMEELDVALHDVGTIQRHELIRACDRKERERGRERQTE
jgi:hypothetical protein